MNFKLLEEDKSDRETHKTTCIRPSDIMIIGYNIHNPKYNPPGTPVSSARKLISSSSFHRLDMTLAVAEALNPNKPRNIIKNS